jgi:hypothetical protein
VFDLEAHQSHDPNKLRSRLAAASGDYPDMTYSAKFARVLVTLLCVFLVFFMTAEMAHSHSGGLLDNAPVHCQLCATAHVAVASQTSWLTGYVLHLIGEVTIGQTSRGSRAVVQTAFIRPPPVDSSLA